MPVKYLLLPALAAVLAIAAPAQQPAPGSDVTPEKARSNFAHPIVLASDDVRAFPEAPEGFKAHEDGIAHGRMDSLNYYSTVTGRERHANVYLPPGYSADKRYPVLYLLHGIGGNEYEWPNYAASIDLFDNLIAKGAMVPAIVVFPNGRALADDRPPKNPFTPENAAGFAKFEGDLFDCLIPAVQTKYATLNDREHRAIAGLSMGGGQSLDFGFGHLDEFAWIGAFSPAPNTRPPAELLPHPADAAKLKLIYLSCGNHDGLINIAQGVHRYLKRHHVPHIWNVDDSGHDAHTWSNNLYYFAQRIFR